MSPPAPISTSPARGPLPALLPGTRPRCGALPSLRLLLVHLRLPFQLLLAPIFLLGALVADGGPTPALLLAFVAVHGAIYGGITAFNSYYDRDRGPVGLLKHPVHATTFVRDAALLLQAAALVVLGLLRPPAALPAALLVLVGIGYSHPRWRWKGNLGASLAAVAGGQGVLAFAIGFLCAGGGARRLLDPPVAAAAAGSALVVLGLYPITQLYQIDEDRARGDRSVPVAIGWRAALVVAGLLVAAGVAVVGVALSGRVGAHWNRVFGAGVPILWGILYLWSRRFPELDPYRNHDWALAIGGAASGVFWLLVVSEWIGGGR